MPGCSSCNRQDATSYFRITRIAGGTENPLALVCSLKCLMTWGYKYAQMNGVMLAARAKNTLDQFIEGLRNLRG